MPDHLDLEILLTVPHVDPDQGFDISPDGSQLIFSWNEREILSQDHHPGQRSQICSPLEP
jgi:hypothetical protein